MNGLGVEREFLDDNRIPCFDDIVHKAVMREVQVALPPSILHLLQHDDGEGNGPRKEDKECLAATVPIRQHFYTNTASISLPLLLHVKSTQKRCLEFTN